MHRVPNGLFFLLLLSACATPPPQPPPGPPRFDRFVELESEAFTSANVSVGDLDGDGHPDIVLAKGRHWPLSQVVLWNDGAGDFARREELEGEADRTYTAALADLNGDGSLDLVVGNDKPDAKRIYSNDGAGKLSLVGSFGEASWPTRNITVADLDRDGWPDLVVANRGGPDRSANFVCLNDGQGAFPSSVELSRDSATTIAAGDMNGDGFPDLVVPHRDAGQGYLYFNDGAGGFSERRPIGPPSASTRAVALGDLDGDGKLDVVLGDDEHGGAQVYLQRGEVEFADPIAIGWKGVRVYSMAVADLDMDGCLDIVLGHRRGPTAVLTSDGTARSFELQHLGDAEGAAYGLAVEDMDGDGRPDILVARSGAVNLLVFNDPARR